MTSKLTPTDPEAYALAEERRLAGVSPLLTESHFTESALDRVGVYAEHVNLNPEMIACQRALSYLAEGKTELAIATLRGTKSSFIKFTKAAAQIAEGNTSVAEAMIARHAARIFAGHI